MKLTTASKVLGRMNLSGTLGSSNPTSIESALDAATPIIESIIRTPLKASSRKDYFDYSLGRYDTFKPFDLWLSQAFVDGKPKIYLSTDGDPVSILTEATLLTADQYLINKEKGKLTILVQPEAGYSTILVRYTAGFKEGSPAIPDWLVEASISAAIFMNHTQAISHGKKDAKAMTEPLSGIIYSVVNEHILTQYSGLYPTNTITA